MTPKPRPRQRTQQGSVSKRDSRLLGLFREDVETRYAARTAEHYLADVSAFMAKLNADALKLRGSYGQKATYDAWGQTGDLGAIDEMRRRVAAKILELQP